MWQSIKNYIQEMSDFKDCFNSNNIASIFNGFFWQINNSGLPLNAGDFINFGWCYIKPLLTHFFEGIYGNYLEKPWRPMCHFI